MTTGTEPAVTARVVGAFGRRMQIRLDDGTHADARIKGKQIQPVCGDQVECTQIADETDWLITAIEKRDNELSRPDRRGHREVLAANLQCVAVMAAVEPKPDWFVVDRYLAAAENMAANAIVIYNKIDLGEPSGPDREALDTYSNVGYPMVTCSADSRLGLDDIEILLGGKVSVIVGQSGVGKSSLANALTNANEQRTAKLSDSTGEGRHTTVNAVMLRLGNGGDLIDSPGVRDYAPMIQSPSEAIVGFREIRDAGTRCRFANCQHRREPDCAVKLAVETGKIAARRMESYRRLLTLARGLAERHFRG